MNKNTLILVAITAVVSAAVTRHYFPKIQQQTVEIEKEVIKTDIRTVTRVIERPDGTKESVTEIVDRTTKRETTSKTATTFQRKDWVVSLGGVAQVRHLDPVYVLQVNRRILGPFYVGGIITTDQQIGISVGLEF